MFIALPSAVKNQVEDISPKFYRVQVLKVSFNASTCVKMVIPEVVKKAANNLKAGKSDPSFSFSSDCFKNGQDNIFFFVSVNSFKVSSYMDMSLWYFLSQH